MVAAQPGAVGRTGRAFKEGVDGKGRGADHEEGENASKDKDENDEKQPLVKLSSNFLEMIFSYLQGS